MSTGWQVYHQAKRGLCDGTIDVNDVFRAHLFASTSNAADLSLTTITELAGEVARRNGYAPVTLVATWDAIAGGYALNFQPIVWEAVGGPIDDGKFVVIATNTGQLLACYARDVATSVIEGHALGIASPSGLFVLS